MNFLQLCQRVRQECSESGDGPSTVVDQTGMLRKIVDWTAQAWEDIQIMRPNWLFMHSEFTLNTIADQRDYTVASASLTDFKLWDVGSFMIRDPAIGYSDENRLPYKPYNEWREAYRAGMQARPSDRPFLFTILPDKSLRFEAVPDKVYTIEGEYKRSTQTLAANSDTPTGLPDDFHMMIVWKAVQYYADDQNVPELLDKGINGYNPLLHRLEIEQLPDMDLAFEALA